MCLYLHIRTPFTIFGPDSYVCTYVKVFFHCMLSCIVTYANVLGSLEYVCMYVGTFVQKILTVNTGNYICCWIVCSEPNSQCYCTCVHTSTCLQLCV